MQTEFTDPTGLEAVGNEIREDGVLRAVFTRLTGPGPLTVTAPATTTGAYAGRRCLEALLRHLVAQGRPFDVLVSDRTDAGLHAERLGLALTAVVARCPEEIGSLGRRVVVYSWRPRG